jgi:TolA-binding protein
MFVLETCVLAHTTAIYNCGYELSLKGRYAEAEQVLYVFFIVVIVYIKIICP